MVFARFLIGQADKGEGRRRFMGFPHAFHRGQFHALGMRGAVAGFVAQQHDRKRSGQTEAGGHGN